MKFCSKSTEEGHSYIYQLQKEGEETSNDVAQS